MRIVERAPRRRTGFTLVELMVAVTLIIFIMVVLTEAFKAGIDAFRDLRARGDAAERLRSAANIIRKDLASPHFESDGPDPTLREFLRDQRLDRSEWQPPPRGFFRIWQGGNQGGAANDGHSLSDDQGGANNPNTVRDSEGLNFTRATNHVLHFTAKYEGDEPGEYFSGLVPVLHNLAAPPPPNAHADKIWWPNNQDLLAFSQTIPPNPPTGQTYRYAARWAEVALFLRPTGETTTDEDGNRGVALHSLHRRVRVIPRTPRDATPRLLIDVNQPDSMNNNLRTRLAEYARDHDASVSSNLVPGTNFPPFAAPNDIPTGRATAPTTPYAIFNNLQAITDPRVRMDADAAGGYTETVAGSGLHRPKAIGELNRTAANATSEGDDILLNDVISFEVKVWWHPHRDIGMGMGGMPPRLQIPRSTDSTVNPSYDTDLPFRDLPDPTTNVNAYKNLHYRTQRARVFDTGIANALLQAELQRAGLPRMNWDSPTDDTTNVPPAFLGYLTENATFRNLNLHVPLRIHVKALQIKLRIWDVKTKTTRQVTIVQEV